MERHQIVLATVAVLACLGFIVNSATIRDAGPDQGRRQLNSMLEPSYPLDPRTISPAYHFHKPEFVSTRNGGEGGRSHLVRAPPEALNKFPFRFTGGDCDLGSAQKCGCAKAQEIIEVSEAIKDLYHTHGIRVFPRNGFLLGIVRHGGFLPNENMDIDLGVVYPDLLDLIDPKTGVRGPASHLDKYKIHMKRTEDYWVNWKGKDPATGEEYPYFGAKFQRNEGYKFEAKAAYPYRDTGGYIYPRLDKIDFNHKVHMIDALRYNKEGADYRMVDTDEHMTEENYADGKQMAHYFDTNFECMMETQFYFTTIYVPCDYDIILKSQYGENWDKVEQRGPRGGPQHASTVMDAEMSDEMIRNGPRPICVGVENLHPEN